MLRTFLFEGKDKITLPARVEAFVKLRQWLLQIAAEINLSQRTTGQLCVVCDEIFTNIALHGYPHGENGTADVAIAVDPDGHFIQITFSDDGMPCNPLEMGKTPDTASPASERHPGGLGLFLVKNLVDEITYLHENDRNILRMTKNFGD